MVKDGNMFLALHGAKTVESGEEVLMSVSELET